MCTCAHTHTHIHAHKHAHIQPHLCLHAHELQRSQAPTLAATCAAAEQLICIDYNQHEAFVLVQFPKVSLHLQPPPYALVRSCRLCTSSPGRYLCLSLSLSLLLSLAHSLYSSDTSCPASHGLSEQLICFSGSLCSPCTRRGAQR